MMQFERIVDQKRVNFIAREIRSAFPSGGRVLDVGCGNGIITCAIGQLGYEITGIDTSEKAIRHAQQHNTLDNVHFQVTGAEDLSAEPEKYHVIICSEVLEHLERPEQLLAVLHVSLHQHGILIVTVPNGRGPRELFVTRPVQALQRKENGLWRLMKKVKRKMGYSGETAQSDADDLAHLHFFTLRALSSLASSAGFRIDRLAASNFIEQVFPFSLLTRKSRTLQKLDCALADRLPPGFTSGFMTVWRKSPRP